MSDRRLAVITGASAGIGTAFAEVLAEQGFDLVLVARRLDRLEQIAERLEAEHPIRAIPMSLDLSDRSAPERLMERLDSEQLVVDVLVNNAGYAIPTRFCDTEWSAIDQFLEVLATGQVHLMHLVVPGMRDRGYGRVMNVASLAAFAPENPGGLYGAVKRFLVSASRAVWMEQRGSDVHVTAVCPGYTWTEFHDVLGNREQISKLPKFMWQKAEHVAREGWRACERNKPVVVTGRMNKLLRIVCLFLSGTSKVRSGPKSQTAATRDDA
ncbi:MAG: SDR family oxidoreductase [Phycisphaerales bacterium]|nr:SDR family oxidoreductase [Phycisphaerales bacterium]